MKILITILIILASLVALLLIIALFVRKEYRVRREVVINASNQKVYDYLKHLRNQEKFNKWVMADPAMKMEFTGTDGSVGFIVKWNGNKQAGEGEQEITGLNEGKKISTKIRFKRPMPAIAHADFITDSLSANQTRVIWNNVSTMKYPMNIMVSMIEKMLAKDMDTSLATLKSILEK